MKERIKGILQGALCAILLAAIAASAFAATTGEVVLSPFNVIFDGKIEAVAGEDYELDGGIKVPYSISYNGVTYLPARKLSELFDVDISFDNDTKTVIIGKPPVPFPTGLVVQQSAPDLITTPTPTPVPAAKPTIAPTPKPTPKPTAKPVEVTVYVTKTGEKYHISSCSYLAKSKISISLSAAKKQGYTACSRCDPPR
jgi:cell division septation protein DedD